ncbi:MAG: cupin domain-containing protein [Rhodospirillales bacterium]|nr:cupin domain-containing protein [Rhodospirillales bacterium]
MSAPTVSLFKAAATLADQALADWGPVPEPSGDTVSHTSGRTLIGGGGTFPEAGYWRCTPGTWRCEVGRAEFCQFLEGECIYTSDSGEVIEIRGGDTAWFPAGWNGRCEVRQTVAKTYVIL